MGRTTLQLRPEARFETVDDGLLVFTHQGARHVEGAGLAPWVEAVRPLLDGRADREDIREAVPPERADAVLRLVDRLVAAGAVREVDLTDPPVVGEEARFVAYFRTGAGAAHARYVETRVAVVGEGPLVALLVEALQETGLRDVVAMGAGGPPSGADPVGAVCQVLGGVDDPAAAFVARWCADRATPLVQVLQRDGAAWLAVPPAADGALPGLHPALRRIAAREVGERPGTGGVPSDAPTAAARLACLRAAHELMRWLCGISDRSPDRAPLLALDVDTLETTEHRVVPHPADLDPVGASAPPWLLGPRTREEVLVGAARIMDPMTGVFGEVTEGALSQLPLNRSSTTVWLPTSDGGHHPRQVHGVGVGFEDARLDTALRAVAAHAVTQRPRGGAAATVRGLDLVDGSTVDVPAEAVLVDGSTSTPDGVAAGLSWDDAVEQALAPAVSRHLEGAVRDGNADVVEVDLDDADERVPYLRAMLRALREDPTAVTVGAGPDLVGVALTSTDGVGPVHWRNRPADALVAAMTARLWSLQRGTDADDDVVATRPPARRPAVPLDRTAATAPRAAASALGGRWVAVPLDGDPAVAAATPFVVRVLEVGRG